MKSSPAAMQWLFSFPALFFIAAFFMAPIGFLVVGSVFQKDPVGGVRLTLDVYRAVLGDSYNYGLLLRTVKLATIVTLVSFVIAFPVALYMRQLSPRWQTLLTFILISPLLTSVVVRTLAWVIVLSPRGLVNNALASLGLPTATLLYNELGVVIGLTHVLLGYMVLALMVSVQKIDENQLLAAANLGASRLSIIREIVLPLSLPGVVAGSVLVFTMAASAYATPMLLGGTKTKVAATEIYNLAIQYADWSSAAVLAIALFVMTAVVVLLGTVFSESGKRKVIFQ